LLPGDGIGPEIGAAARAVLARLGDFEITEHLIGGASIDEHGTALTDEVLEACRQSDAVLLCAVGGPKWDTTDPDKPRPEQGLLGLRKGLGLFANLRPVRPSEALLEASPLRRDRIEGTDLLVVRELTGGIYFGESGRDGDRAHDDCAYTVEEIERIARVAFEAAGERNGRVTSVDKANVLETSRLWRETVTRLAPEYEEIELDHLLVDNAAMQLVSNPTGFDVLVTENLFGDILSDEASVLAGSLGMLPSASIGTRRTPHGLHGLYEPIHGSAPDIAGRDVANPIGTILSGAMLLRWSLGRVAAADAIEAAVGQALDDGFRTADLWPVDGSETAGLTRAGTIEMTQAIVDRIAANDPRVRLGLRATRGTLRRG
jgi:3-isopropylmalate dehydrogenase